MKALSALWAIVRATGAGLTGAFLWVLQQVLTEHLFRGFAIDVTRYFLKWAARTIPGEADDRIIARIIKDLDRLEARPDA